jgi:hypothetical protein
LGNGGIEYLEEKIRKKLLEGGEKTEARRMRGGREEYYNGGCLAGPVVG